MRVWYKIDLSSFCGSFADTKCRYVYTQEKRERRWRRRCFGHCIYILFLISERKMAIIKCGIWCRRIRVTYENSKIFAMGFDKFFFACFVVETPSALKSILYQKYIKFNAYINPSSNFYYYYETAIQFYVILI